MAQDWQSFVTKGQVVRGVCYASPTNFLNSTVHWTHIPPERVGLLGEYDYYGLAKRIQAQFKERLGRTEATKIGIKQRGSAIILSGHVHSRTLLDELITLALQTDGTTQVEVCDMQVDDLSPTQDPTCWILAGNAPK